MPEKRHFDRLRLDGNVHIKSENGQPLESKAFLENNSYVGFGMYSTQKFIPESVVDFELTAQQLDRPISGKGKVCYVAEPASERSPFYRMGVEFIDTNKDAVTYLIKRLHAKMSEDTRSRTNTAHVDFIPY